MRATLSDLDRGPNVFRVRASDIVSELSHPDRGRRRLRHGDAAGRASPSGSTSVTRVFVWSNGGRLVAGGRGGHALRAGRRVRRPRPLAHGASGPRARESEGDGADEAGPEAAGEPARKTIAGARPRSIRALAAREALPTVEDARTGPSRAHRGHVPAARRTWRSCASCWPSPRSCWAASPSSCTCAWTQTMATCSRAIGAGVRSSVTTRPRSSRPTSSPRQVQCLQWLLASRGAAARAGPAGALRRGLRHLHHVRMRPAGRHSAALRNRAASPTM